MDGDICGTGIGMVWVSGAYLQRFFIESVSSASTVKNIVLGRLKDAANKQT